ncbi:MAG: zinc transporter ZntB [Gammaproteobacteria bacterium]|jgi:zinc transporter
MTIMETTDGLINAYLLDGDGGGRLLDWSGVRGWQQQDGPLWVHLDFTDNAAQQWLLEESGLERIVADDLIADETRPRCEVLADSMLISLRGVNSNPGADPEDMVSIRIYADGHRIITTRRRRLFSIRDITEAVETGRGPASVGELIADLAQRLIERMSQVITGLDDRIDELEEEVLKGAGRELRHDLLDIRREMLKLRRYLSPQREALSQIQACKCVWLSSDDRMQIREANNKVIRYLEDLDSAKDRASVAHEAISNHLAEEMNSRMYVLSLVAALFLPLGFLTGLLGINVGGIPLAENPHGFLGIVVIIVVLVAIQIVVFIRKKWF